MARTFFLTFSLVILSASISHAADSICQYVFAPQPIRYERPLGAVATALLEDLKIHGTKAQHERWPAEYQVHAVWPDVVKASRKNKLQEFEIAALQLALVGELNLIDPSLRLDGARLLLLDWQHDFVTRLRPSTKTLVTAAHKQALSKLNDTDPRLAVKFFKDYVSNGAISEQYRLYMMRDMLEIIYDRWESPEYPALNRLSKELTPLAYEAIRFAAQTAYTIQKPKYAGTRHAVMYLGAPGVDTHVWADTNMLVNALSSAKMRIGDWKYERRAYEKIKKFHDGLEPFSPIKY